MHDALDVKGSRMLDEIWVVTFFAAVAGDVLSGALRYYLSIAGVGALAYLPKVMMLVCMALIIINRPKISHLLVALFMAMAGCVSMANGQDLAGVGLWIWTISPMFFAMLAPEKAFSMLERRGARLVFLLLGVVCAVGVLINYFVVMPWVGTSVNVGGVDVHVSAASWTGGVRRLAGFGRQSSTTGLMLGVLATWLLTRFRSPVAALLLLAGSGLAIWGTTNKTTLLSLGIVLFLSQFSRLISVRKVCMWTAAIVVVFPFVAYAAIAAHGKTGLDSGLLFSFEDRIYNTWPLILQGMVRNNLQWFGLGAGGFGSATLFYPGGFDFNVLYADNMALYVMATFGLVGVALGTLLLAKILVSPEPESSPVWIMLFFLLSTGITTDIFESMGGLLFLGIVAKALWISEASPVPLAPYEAMPVRHRVAPSMARRQ